MQAINHKCTNDMQATQSTILCDWIEALEDMNGEYIRYCGLVQFNAKLAYGIPKRIELNWQIPILIWRAYLKDEFCCVIMDDGKLQSEYKQSQALVHENQCSAPISVQQAILYSIQPVRCK